MRASGSTRAFGPLPRPQAQALVQFHPEPGLDARRAVQSPDTDKPFFEKRTKTVGAMPTEVSIGPFCLLPTQFLVLEGDKPVPLGSRALEILIVLLERPGELVSKQELMCRVWPNVFVEPANLTVHVGTASRAARRARRRSLHHQYSRPRLQFCRFDRASGYQNRARANTWRPGTAVVGGWGELQRHVGLCGAEPVLQIQ